MSASPRLVVGPATSRPRAVRSVVVVGVVAVVVAAWWFVLAQATGAVPGPAEILQRVGRFAADLAGAGRETTPAYADPDQWWAIRDAIVDTVVMSVLAVGFAGSFALATIGPASRVSAIGSGSRLGRIVRAVTRGVHAVLRAVPELVWALLVVFLLRPGLLAGALALAIHEAGVLGRLGSDVVDDVDRRSLAALRSTGARDQQVLLYGVLPQVLPQLVGFLLYRWEVVIRATVVVGFVTGSGLGHQLRMALSFRRWTEVALVLLAYVLLVWAVEGVAVALRRLAR